MDEIITWRVLFSLVIILIGIYIFKKIIKGNKNKWELRSIEASFLSIFALISFFIFLIISKFSHKIRNGSLLDKDFLNHQLFMTCQLQEVEG